MIKKYIDLNESYDNGELRYWCNNTIGEKPITHLHLLQLIMETL